MGHFRRLVTASISEPDALIVHAHGKRYNAVAQGRLSFFERIAEHGLSLGIPSYLVDQSDIASKILRDSNHINIIFGPSQEDGENIFHADESYIVGFWYLDPKGVFWNSSLQEKSFDQTKIDIKKATYFFNGVSGFMTRENYSKRPQSDRAASTLPGAQAVIFTQNIEKYMRPIHHLTLREIVETTASGSDELVYLKPHPLFDAGALKSLADICKPFPNVQISNASVHDLIQASGLVISQNSAAGFEAMMHQTPAILCAECDYHHGAMTARTPQQLTDAIQNAPSFAKSFPFTKYFYWFLHDQMLEVQKPDFADRAWTRLMANR